MIYLIAVLSDRSLAQKAYHTLAQEGIPTEKMTILGEGYQTPSQLDFIDPSQKAKRRALLMSYWLVPFGFAAGYTFNYITGLETFAWAGQPGNHILGGFLGAIGGAMGSYFIGSGFGLSNDEPQLPYTDYLAEGKYLVVLEDEGNLIKQARNLLQQFKPENLQSFTQSI